MSPIDPADLALNLSAIARATRQRRILVLSGTPHWARASGIELRTRLDAQAALWVGDHSPSNWLSCTPHSTRRHLGQEFDLVCLDAFSGFDPDDFGVLSGTLIGGGLFCLLCPPLERWPFYDDPEYARICVLGGGAPRGRFLKRLVGFIGKVSGACVLTEEGLSHGDPMAIDALDRPVWTPKIGDDGCVNEEQRAAVRAVVHVAKGHRRRPVVLTADRGRGKSAALGLAAAELLLEKEATIVVTGPSLAAVDPVFTHARARLPQSQRARAELVYGAGRLKFVAPDALAQSPVPADLVLIDEAAGLPQALLLRLLQVYPRLAFATTVHGYEGSGRAFALRFSAQLNAWAPGWRYMTLHHPVRWSTGDPLESLSFRALLLDAEPANPENFADLPISQAEIECVDRDVLASDEALLSEVFGLLMSAHYRTRPLDLRQLLDGPTISIWIARLRGAVAAVALLAEEGGLASDLAAEVAKGRRRARGHLLPQVLAAHCGHPEAMSVKGWRILRLAVHPVVQRRGLGSTLLSCLATKANARGLHWIGASFGATAPLLDFWRQTGFMPVRIGATREAISGSYPALVMRPLSREIETLYFALRQRYLGQLPHLLGDFLSNLDPEIAVSLLAREEGDPPGSTPELDFSRDFEDFAHGRRDFEDALGALWHLSVGALSQIRPCSLLDCRMQNVLVMRVLQIRSWTVTAKYLGLPGRRQVVDLLREAVRVLIS